MADPVGLFDATAVPEGWFDEAIQPVGWFDQDLLDLSGETPLDPEIYDWLIRARRRGRR